MRHYCQPGALLRCSFDRRARVQRRVFVVASGVFDGLCVRARDKNRPPMASIDTALLTRNFMLGGALAAAYTALRCIKRSNDGAERIVLDPQPRNIPHMCPDLMGVFREISACCARARKSDASTDDVRRAYKRHVRAAIVDVDDLLCIEIQLARGEMTPSHRDVADAQMLAVHCMRSLRAVEPMLAWSTFWYDRVRQQNDAVQSAIDDRLNNITKYVYGT